MDKSFKNWTMLADTGKTSLKSVSSLPTNYYNSYNILPQVELATGNFPYPGCRNEFEVLMKIINEPAPILPPNEGFSEEFQSFLTTCLQKNLKYRPKFDALLVSYCLQSLHLIYYWRKNNENDTTNNKNIISNFI